MYKIILSINLILWIPFGFSQTADETIGRLIREQNFFELQEKHFQLKEQLNPMVYFFSQAILAQSFNNPVQGINAIDTLLINPSYQQQLGIDNIAYLIYLKADFLETLFRYEEASVMLKYLFIQTKEVILKLNLQLIILEMGIQLIFLAK